MNERLRLDLAQSIAVPFVCYPTEGSVVLRAVINCLNNVSFY